MAKGKSWADSMQTWISVIGSVCQPKNRAVHFSMCELQHRNPPQSIA